ncbi:hypothetical protein [Pseudoxanthomonas sp. PXM05]|uniref:hypothetical protein n=1 Tax=Pseudoxanthomonas sp. PXM05 TaxID=2854775 RepID=UPI001C4384AC|nr:hypothetical protein [Pseudoxanthomonas sp. PXM05]MBV7475365.1 hypothetical protein [Pseudoxanthomonas sp. PXM05]
MSNEKVRDVDFVAEGRNSVIVVGGCFVECLGQAELQALVSKGQRRLDELRALSPTHQSEAEMAGERG